MTEFNPPISERNTEELIEIVHHGGWQLEATRQAKEELLKRNISIQEQEKFIEENIFQFQKLATDAVTKFENNENESYKPWQIFLIFIFGPFLLTNRFPRSLTIFGLYSQNYKLKFKQRILTLFLSICFYSACILYYVNWKEEQWQKEIEKVDISDWKKYHGY